MELDHLFICVDGNAEVADLLCDFGLSEGTASRHPGQGTANRRFYFNNAFIEFLFLVDTEEALSAITKPTNLYERLSCTTDQVSPFGVCFRPSKEGEKVPFPTWSYRPKYLPPSFDVSIAQAPVFEPMWFHLDFAKRPDAANSDNRQTTDHRCGYKEISSVKITFATLEELSDAATVANATASFDLFRGSDHLLEIVFDLEREGEMKDFRPALPLIFRW